MTEQPLVHKLAAILYTDVEGYSRLTGADESGTHRTLSAYLDLFAETIRDHRGEVKHYAGDAVLADFTTVSDALNCAVAVQKAIKEKNEAIPEGKRVQFRIGLNLGEVIVDRGEVYGNGVNVAARLETLAEPGGICVSGNVVDAVGTKLALRYEYMGEHRVKNIDKPVRAYRVTEAQHGSPLARQRLRFSLKRLSSARTVAMAVLVVLTSVVALWIALRGAPDGAPALMRRATIQLTGHGDPRPLVSFFGSNAPWFALSRDGLLVYTVQGSTEPMQSRRLDAPTSRPVDGTRGGATPFLSPDGQMLGFERDGEMFVVPTSGGPTTRVKDAILLVSGGRPAWTPDGRVVYTSERGALVMVRPDGTSSEQLTTPVGGARHFSPVLLPDGQNVLFTEIGGNINEARIVVLSFSGRRTRTLVSGGAMTPQYADGFLFYCRPEGTLMAAPFDPARVELTGQAHALPDRVDRSRFGVAHYAAAPGVLLYEPYANTRLVEMDATGAVTVLTEEGRWHMPRYSPDGTRILLDHIIGEGAERDIWTLSRADKTLSRVTRVGDAHDPTWLPNGKEVSFLSFKSPGGPLMMAAADGSGEPHAMRIAGPFRPIALVNPGLWLSDGSAYLAGVVEGSGRSDIWRLPRDGTPAVKLVGGPFHEHSPSVSADGRWLAYQSNETGRAEVYVRPLSGAEGRLQVSSASATAPVWDKRSLTLYYLEMDGARLHLVAASLRTTPALAVIGRRVVLADVRLQEADNHPNYDVDPSGTKFVMPEQAPTVGLGAIFDVATSLHSAENRRK